MTVITEAHNKEGGESWRISNLINSSQESSHVMPLLEGPC